MSVNLPATQWQDPLGIYEFGTDGPNYIVDTTGAYLVDPSAVYIVDTGVSATRLAATAWTEDDSL